MRRRPHRQIRQGDLHLRQLADEVQRQDAIGDAGPEDGERDADRGDPEPGSTQGGPSGRNARRARGGRTAASSRRPALRPGSRQAGVACHPRLQVRARSAHRWSRRRRSGSCTRTPGGANAPKCRTSRRSRALLSRSPRRAEESSNCVDRGSSHDHAATSLGRSTNRPFSNLAPARTSATRCGPLTAPGLLRADGERPSCPQEPQGQAESDPRAQSDSEGPTARLPASD